MKTFLAFLGGAVAGAAIALLLAPEKGEVTRRKIKDAVNHGIDEAEKKAQNLRRKTDKAVKTKISGAAETAKSHV